MEQWDLLHLELEITLIRKNRWNYTKVRSFVHMETEKHAYKINLLMYVMCI